MQALCQCTYCTLVIMKTERVVSTWPECTVGTFVLSRRGADSSSYLFRANFWRTSNARMGTLWAQVLCASTSEGDGPCHASELCPLSAGPLFAYMVGSFWAYFSGKPLFATGVVGLCCLVAAL